MNLHWKKSLAYLSVSLAMGLASCLGLNDSGSKSGSKNVVGASAEDLQSLQVAVENIYLAQDLKINGTGFDNPTGLLTFYNQPDLERAPDHNLITAANALDASFDKYFVDFMKAEDRQRISQGATFDESHLGEYNSSRAPRWRQAPPWRP